MLHQSKDQLADLGFRTLEEIKDKDGTIAIIMLLDGDLYCLVSKEYAYKELASFMEKIVRSAVNQETKLIFHQNDVDEYHVFDPNTVEEFGKPSTGKSKKAMSEWIEIPLSYGVKLRDYMNGVELTLPKNQKQLKSY